VRTGIGRSAELDYIIHLMLDIDPLLLVSRIHHQTAVIPDATGFKSVVGPSVGEYWHLKGVEVEDKATSDYTYNVAISAPGSGSESANNLVVGLSRVAAGAAVPFPLSLIGITLRPGQDLGIDVSSWTAGGGGTGFKVLYDLEDCSS